jgi:hypothetical protein
MFEGYWRTAIAAGLTLTAAFVIGGYILGYQLGEEAGKKDAHTKEYERHAADEIERTCLRLDPIAEAECIVRVINSAHEHKRAESDLIAQRNMARWALFMLISTVVMAAITGLGVYYVWRTLAITSDIGMAEVRAYIYDFGADIEADNNTIGVTFKNFGNSPGSISFIECKVLVSDPYACKVLWGQSLWSDGFSVAPSASEVEHFRLDNGRGKYLKSMIEQDGISVCVQGRFQSVDVFKKVHLHGFNIVLSDGVKA